MTPNKRQKLVFGIKVLRFIINFLLAKLIIKLLIVSTIVKIAFILAIIINKKIFKIEANLLTI